jgi:hypothetical protein
MDAQFTLPITQFQGIVSNADPFDLPPGAMQVQENMQVRRAGELQVRNGLTDYGVTRSSTRNIISLYKFNRPDADWFVWQDALGNVEAIKVGSTGSPTTLGTGYSTFQPICFAQTRTGVLIGVNGLNAPFRWDGMTAALEPLGIPAPAAAPTITTPTGGSLTAGDYLLAFRYLDDDVEYDEFNTGTGSGIPSSFSPVQTATAAANDEFTWAIDVSAAIARVRKVEFWRTAAGDERVYYRLEFTGPGGAAQTYLARSGTFSAAADSGGKVQMTMPTGHGLAVNATFSVPSGTYAGAHTVTAVTATTVTTDVNYSSNASGTWTLTGCVNDGISDDDLQELQDMSFITPDGRKDIANRFVPPPSDMPYVAFLQDRLFFAGMVHYTEGTVATTAGSTTITGTGTSWLSTMVGRRIYIAGENVGYTITGFTSTTQVTIDLPAANTSSGLAYAISPPYDNRNKVRFSEVDSPEAVPLYNEIILQESHEQPDEITGLAPNQTALIVGQNHHLFALRFFRQPDIDAQPSLIANRGMINNRSWVRYGSALYIRDAHGIYMLQGDGAQPIDQAINDFVRSSTWTGKGRLDFAVANQTLGYVRFHLTLATESSALALPTRWFEYWPNKQLWVSGYYDPGVGHGVMHAPRGQYQQRTYYGGLNRRILVDQEGNTNDGTLVTGTVTSATSTTLSDSTATFTDALLDAPVSIISGTGKGQTRTITARSTTELTVGTAWTTDPDTTSVYAVGAVPWQFKTGIMTLGGRGQDANYATLQAMRVIFTPTSNDSTFDIRRYLDQDTSPVTCDYVSESRGDYLRTELGSADTVVDMRRDRYTQANQAGFVAWRFGGHRVAPMLGDRFCTFEFRGFQLAQPIVIHDLILNSVE